ncbi:hypothetical protein ACQCX5_01765 [Propionibacteriaceae bacterium G57]|uniref:hypothetical protein n=1 Tax=Aestuariimicrobium sp. G57 TaxID=3418485 RepID=UPI003DA7003F
MSRASIALVLAGVLALGACTSSPDDAGTLPSGHPTAATGDYTQTDATLAAAIGKVSVNGTLLQAFPVDLVRKDSGLPSTDPAKCNYAATGYLEQVLAGRPAGYAFTNARLTVTIVDMGGDAGAKQQVARRDTALDDPGCATVRTTYQGQTATSTLKAVNLVAAGLESPRGMVSTSSDGTSSNAEVSGRKGNVLVHVAQQGSTDVTRLADIAADLGAALG